MSSPSWLKFSLSIGLVLCLVLGLTLAPLAYAATLIDLGTLGGTFSTANDVNSAGQVVGYSYIADGSERAFLWQSGVMTDLGTLPGYTQGSRAEGINSAGQVVGTSSNGGFYVHAFLWQSGTMTDLGSLLSGNYNGAYDINDAGQIVGEASTLGDTAGYAFLRQPDGTVINLGTLPGYVGSTAFSINSAGQVVGVAWTASHAGRAFLWQGGVMTDLGTLPGYTSNSYAYDINTAGQVVGYASNASGTTRAFLWQSGSGMTNLGTLGGADSAAYGINDTGQIVGSSGILGGPITHAFFRSTDGTMTDLGVLAGYTSSAQAINNALQIVGASTSSEGPSHAFLTQVVNCSESITVTTNADNGAGSLRQAIANVCNGGTITFASNLSGATIALSSTLTLDKPQTIDGSTLAAHVILSGDSNGDSAGDVQVLNIMANVTATLKSLTITKGQSMTGGGLRNQGTLTISDSLFISNTATWGGGLQNAGTLTITASTFLDNNAPQGGGLNNAGALTVTASTFSGNTADQGGGLYNTGTGSTVLTDSAFFTNTAATFGGGIQNIGALSITDGTFSQNTADQGGGGGITNQSGTLTVTNSHFFTNTAQWGGGLYNDPSGTVTMKDGTFTANESSSQGGGLVNHGTMTVTHGLFNSNTSAWGGGLANTGHLTALTASTFVGNTASDSGGGLANSGSLTALNSTLSGNTATQRGGGVYNDTNVSAGALTMTHVTIAGSASNSSLYNAANSKLHLKNSLIANSTGVDCVNLGTLTTNTRNLVEDGTCSPALSGDPVLSALADHGGATLTLALGAASPAIDGGDAASCLPIDQRGQPRDDLQCDIGAYELKYTDSPTVIRPITSTVTTTFGPTRLGLERGIVDPGIITVTRSLTWGTVPTNTIAAYWLITPTVSTGFNLTLTLCYTAAESNGLDLSAPHFWRYSANQWHSVAGVAVTSTVGNNLCATLGGITELSAWTIGGTDVPLAVGIKQLAASTPQPDLSRPLALGLLAVLIVSSSVWFRRRRA